MVHAHLSLQWLHGHVASNTPFILSFLTEKWQGSLVKIFFSLSLASPPPPLVLSDEFPICCNVASNTPFFLSFFNRKVAGVT